MAIVYRHIRLDKNEPFYVGIGKTEKRAYSIHGRNKLWKNIILKTEYRVDILFDDLTWHDACEKEKEFIKLYGRDNLRTGTLCNLTDGGDGAFGSVCSDERREKVSNSMIGKNKGKKLSEAQKLKISQSLKGKKYTNQQIKDFSLVKQKPPKPYRMAKIQKPNGKKWYVMFRRFGVNISLGCFYTEQEAQAAIDKWLLENKFI